MSLQVYDSNDLARRQAKQEMADSLEGEQTNTEGDQTRWPEVK